MKHCAVMVVMCISLVVLVSCGSAQTGANSAATTTRPPQSATATPLPTNTPYVDQNPFQVRFLQHYQVVACPVEPTPTNLCYTLQDDPSASSLGMLSFAGEDILFARPPDTTCGPASRTGSLQLADGDTITLQATGTYCVPSYAMQLTFTVSGGTGQYQHASGSGSIAVGAARATTADEFWSGTINA